MIFVSLGTHPRPFSRLINELKKLADNGTFREKIIVQTGSTPFVHPKMEVHAYLSIPEFEKTLGEADVFLTHAGEGNMGTALRAGVPMVIVPRRVGLGEHTDDHQMELARAAERNGYGGVVYDVSNLGEAIRRARNAPRELKRTSYFLPALEQIAREHGISVPPATKPEKFVPPKGASIVVATLNGGEPLIKAVKGMLSQDFKGKYEVIVVDDGSFDGKTPQLLKKNFEKNPKVKLIFLPRSGVCKARNAGIRAAQYEVVINMDHDDNPEPDWLRIMVGGFDSSRVGAVSAYGHYGGTSTGFRKDVLDHLGGYDEEFFYYREDTDLSFRIMELGLEYRKVDGAKWHGDRTLVTPRGIGKLFAYTRQRLKYHLNDVLLHKKHRSKLCTDFLHVRAGIFVDPVEDFKVATGLWQDENKEPALSSPRGMTFFGGRGFIPFALIVLGGLGYVLAIKMARLAGSVRHGHLLV